MMQKLFNCQRYTDFESLQSACQKDSSRLNTCSSSVNLWPEEGEKQFASLLDFGNKTETEVLYRYLSKKFRTFNPKMRQIEFIGWLPIGLWKTKSNFRLQTLKTCFRTRVNVPQKCQKSVICIHFCLSKTGHFWRDLKWPLLDHQMLLNYVQTRP